MESQAKLFGHPIHPMLIVFPLGLLATAFVFDIVGLLSGSVFWFEMSFWLIAIGVVTGLVAGVFGLVDWLAIPPRTRAKAIGAYHGLGNVVVLVLFVASWLLRFDAPARPEGLAIIFAGVAVALALVTGWLGGELVNRLGIGVADGAHANAPSSLSKRPASDRARPFREVEQH